MQSLTLPRRASVKGLGKTLNIAIPVAIAALAASAAYAGADTTFTQSRNPNCPIHRLMKLAMIIAPNRP